MINEQQVAHVPAPDRRQPSPRDGSTAPRPWLRHVPATLGWIALTLPLAVVLGSVALSPASNWIAQAALAGFCLLAIRRPDAALLVTAALVGFGIILSHLAGVPSLRVSELLVVASLAGCCVRALPPSAVLRRAFAELISAPVVLFATAVVASTVVWEWVHQVQMGYPSVHLSELLRFLSRDYFFRRDEFSLLVTTATILEGLALYVVVAGLCRMDSTFFARGLRMMTLGAAALGVLSVVRLAEILLRSPDAIEFLRTTGAGLRISPQIPDYIAAGSYFALCWIASLGLALSSPRRLVWVAAGVPLMAALYLTGSRSVIAAALAGLLLLLFITARRRTARFRGVGVFAATAVVVMVISYPWMSGRDVIGESAKISLQTRVELARTSVRVIETRPLFGIGLERYHLSAGALATPELNALWPFRKNPHNDFLRVGAELGLVGLALFVWILVAAGRRIWRALQSTADPRLAGLAGGLTAFLVTSLVSDPLMVREVSYVFWMALGLAVGHAVDARPEPEVQHEEASAPRRRIVALLVALLIGAVLVYSIPSRARQELASIDLSHVTYGLLDWSTDPDGAVYRWSGPRVRLFVDGRARRVDISLSGTLPSGAPQQVELWLDGRLANRISIGREWQRISTVLPAETRANPYRIDLVISPSWVPADVIPESNDRRELGVKVGKVTVTSAAS